MGFDSHHYRDELEEDRHIRRAEYAVGRPRSIKESVERSPEPFSKTCRVAVSENYLTFLEQNWRADTLTTVIYSITGVRNYGTWKRKDMHRLVAWNRKRRIGGIAGIIEKQEVSRHDTLGIESLALQGSHPYHYVMLDIDADKTVLQDREDGQERNAHLLDMLAPLADTMSLSFEVFRSSKNNFHVVSHSPVEWKDYKFAVEHMGRNGLIDPGYSFHTLHRHSGVVRISEKNGSVPTRYATVNPRTSVWI